MLRRLTIATAVCAALAGALAATATADGLPVPVDGNPQGVTSLDGKYRFESVADRGDTLVARTSVDGGQIGLTELVRGRFSVPAVAIDASPSGLSADGSRLVLIRPRVSFPRRRTTFAILDAERLRLQRVLTLRGDFSFDAISPDGDSMFLIQYSRRNPRAYRVREYDLVERQLLPGPIVDPSEEPGEMNGYPLSRALSPDGRWAYTLYDGGDAPFIHALDTEGAAAVCIDLDHLAGTSNFGLGLVLDRAGDLMTVVRRATRKRPEKELAVVDTQTFDVTQPEAASQGDPAGDGGTPKLVVGLGGLLAVMIAAGAVAGWRRERSGPLRSRA